MDGLTAEVNDELMDLVELQNLTATFSLGRGIDILELLLVGVNIEQKFGKTNAQIKLRRPNATATIFPSGKVNVVGCRSESEMKQACRRFARIVQKLSVKRPCILTKGQGDVTIKNFRIHNAWGSVSLPFDVKLQEFAKVHSWKKCCTYEPELNAAVVYQIEDPLMKATARILQTGHVCFQASRVSAIYSALTHLYPLLWPFRKAKKIKKIKQKIAKGSDRMWKA